MSLRLGFAGLGPIGKAITKRLVTYGSFKGDLLIYNRTASTAELHAQTIGRATTVKSFHDLVQQTDLVWSCVVNDAAVLDLYNSVTAGPLKGKLFVDCSTISGAAVDEVNQKVQSAGGEFVSMPVFGEAGAAETGQLIVVPAGPASAIDRIRPFLIDVIAASVVDFPDQPVSKASLLKLIGNVMIMTTLEQVAEMLVFADKTGLGTEHVQRLLKAVYPGGPQQHTKYANLMVAGGYHQSKTIVETKQAIELAEKVTSLAQTHGVQLRGYEVAIDHLREASSAAGPASDVTGIYGAVRKASGMDFETQ